MRRRGAIGVVLAVYALVVPTDWQVLTAAGGGSSADAAAGDVWSFGAAVYVRNDADQRITLRAAELVGVHGLRSRGVIAHGPRRSAGYLGGGQGFPPQYELGDVVPLSGTVVPSGQWGIALTFGVSGVGSADGFAVTYEVGGRRYRQVFKAPMAVLHRPAA